MAWETINEGNVGTPHQWTVEEDRRRNGRVDVRVTGNPRVIEVPRLRSDRTWRELLAAHPDLVHADPFLSAAEYAAQGYRFAVPPRPVAMDRLARIRWMPGQGRALKQGLHRDGTVTIRLTPAQVALGGNFTVEVSAKARPKRPGERRPVAIEDRSRLVLPRRTLPARRER